MDPIKSFTPEQIQKAVSLRLLKPEDIAGKSPDQINNLIRNGIIGPYAKKPESNNRMKIGAGIGTGVLALAAAALGRKKLMSRSLKAATKKPAPVRSDVEEFLNIDRRNMRSYGEGGVLNPGETIKTFVTRRGVRNGADYTTQVHGRPERVQTNVSNILGSDDRGNHVTVTRNKNNTYTISMAGGPLEGQTDAYGRIISGAVGVTVADQGKARAIAAHAIANPKEITNLVTKHTSLDDTHPNGWTADTEAITKYFDDIRAFPNSRVVLPSFAGMNKEGSREKTASLLRNNNFNTSDVPLAFNRPYVDSELPKIKGDRNLHGSYIGYGDVPERVYTKHKPGEPGRPGETQAEYDQWNGVMPPSYKYNPNDTINL